MKVTVCWNVTIIQGFWASNSESKIGVNTFIPLYTFMVLCSIKYKNEFP